MHRRRILATLVFAGGSLLSAIVALPAVLAALSPSLRPRSRQAWRSLGRLEDFRLHTVEQATVEVQRGDWSETLPRKAVYVWRKEEGRAVVYSRNCTDLSCPVHFDSGSERFFCPCHGGIFAKDGTPLAGPPRLPLYRYRTRVRGGELEIDLRSLPAMH